MIQNKLLIFTLLLSTTATLLAQHNTSSTYSRFGIGIREQRADATNAGMGYAGVALPSQGYLNTLNAASYSALDSARFLFNIQGKMAFATYQTKSSEQQNIDANIESVGFGFKVAKNWGMGLSLSPYSSVGYSIETEKYFLGTTNRYPVTYEGSGGITQLSWYNGIQLFKGFSIGLNTSYLWGSTDLIEVSHYPTIIGETMYNERSYHVSTLLLEYGFQYHQPLGLSQLSIGATANISSEMNTYYTHRIYNNQSNDLSYKRRDTDIIVIPDNFTVGAALQTSKGWLFAADYRYSEWAQADLAITHGTCRNTHGASVGIQYAAPRFHRSLFKRMQYRMGAFYNQQYLTIHGQDIDEHGVTAGLGIPMRDGSMINLGYEYKRVGTTNYGLMQEQYHTIKFGLTFNENWFRKNKFH